MLKESDEAATRLPDEVRERYPEVAARISVARNGYKRDFIMGGQWYPKPGVFWHGAWNCHQYHATTEFFSDFATSSASESFAAGMPPLSRMNFVSGASPASIAPLSAASLPGAPFAMSSFAISSAMFRTAKRFYYSVAARS